jgi:fructose-1,6-bisphosphatase/inositol monophosphatase family enzyme
MLLGNPTNCTPHGLKATSYNDYNSLTIGLQQVTPFSRYQVEAIADLMLDRVLPVLLDRPEDDRVLSGAHDTGTVVLKSDKDICKLFREFLSRMGEEGFSEELDPSVAIQNRSENQSVEVPTRLFQPKMVQVDPVDGSGDRKYGSRGTPSGDGFTSLVSFIENRVAVGGICLRPAHGELWIFQRGAIELWKIAHDGKILERLPFMRPERDRDDNVIKVNFRPAYPKANFPDEVLVAADSISGGALTFEAREAGGAGDSFCRLLKGELDIVTSGRTTDWKTWDTDPFAMAIAALGGCVCDYAGNPLRLSPSRDPQLVHLNGVFASIGVTRAAQLLRDAIDAANTPDQFGRPLVYDPKTLL